MTVGVLILRLLLRESQSLKDKRRIVKSLKDHIHNKFNVSAAEVDLQDDRKLAEIGVAAVGTDDKIVDKVLREVREFASYAHGAELVKGEIELIY